MSGIPRFYWSIVHLKFIFNTIENMRRCFFILCFYFVHLPFRLMALVLSRWSLNLHWRGPRNLNLKHPSGFASSGWKVLLNLRKRWWLKFPSSKLDLWTRRYILLLLSIVEFVLFLVQCFLICVCHLEKRCRWPYFCCWPKSWLSLPTKAE